MEAELSNLVVRLTGEASDYLRMLNESQQATQQTAAKVEESSKRIEDFTKALKTFAGQASKSLGLLGVSINLMSAMGKFNEAEENIIRLSAAIESNGGNAAAASAQYGQFADSLEKVTTLTKGQIMGMVKQGEMQGLAGESLQRLIKFSVGFGEATGVSAEHAMTLGIAMERGNIHMLRRIPQLRGITSEEEIRAKAQELSNTGLRIANQLSETSAVKLAKLEKSLKGLAKDIGGMVAGVLTPFIERLKAMADWFNSLDKTVRKVVVTFLVAIGSVSAVSALWGKLAVLILPFSSGLTLIGAALGPIVGLFSYWLNPLNLARVLFLGLSTVFTSVGSALLFLVNPLNLARVAFTLMGPMVASLGTLLLFLLNPINLVKIALLALKTAFAMTGVGLAFIVIGAIVAGLVETFGGWGNALKEVQAWALQAWEEIKVGLLALWPVLKETWKILLQVWEGVLLPIVKGVLAGIYATFLMVKDGITEGFKALTGSSGASWTEIKEFIQETLLKAEFGLKNFQMIWDHVWASIKLVSTRFFLDLIHWFTVTLPEAISQWITQATDLFNNLFNLSMTIFGNLVSNVVRLFTSIPGLISGTISWDEVWRPLTEGFTESISALPGYTQREMSELEGNLLREWETTGARVNSSWEEFRRRRIEELRREDRAGQESDDRDKDQTKNKKERHEKLDSALAGSAEALARIQAFQEKMAQGADSSRPGGPPPGSPRPGNPALGGLGAAFANIGRMGEELWGNIQRMAQDTWNSISNWARTTWTEITTQAGNFWNWLMRLPQAAWDEAVIFFTLTLPALAQVTWDEAVTFFTTTLPNWALQSFDRLVTDIFGLWDSIDWDALLDAGQKFFLETLPDAAWNFFTITAPNAFAFIMEEIGSFFTETVPALWQTIIDAAMAFFTVTIPRWWESAVRGITVFFTETLPNAWNTFFSTTLPGFASDAWNRVYDFAAGVWQRVQELVTNLMARVLQRVSGGLLGGEGGPVAAITQTLQTNLGLGGGEGNNGNAGLLGALNGIGTTLQGIASRPDQLLQNLGIGFGGS